MAENIINKVLKDERPFYQQAFENSIDALPDDLSTGHGKAMYTPNGIVDRAQSVGDYHKMANADLSNRISNKIGENYGNLAQAGYNLFSPALSIPASFGYDYSQAKDRMEPDSGIMGLGKAFMDESPFSAAYQRAVGVADPFFQQFGMTTVPENALKNNLRPANINFTNLLQQDVNKDIYNGYKSEQPADAISRTNVEDLDYEADLGAFMNPNIQPSQNMFQRAGNAIQSGLGSIKDFMPFIGNKSLTGMAMQGLGRVGEGIGNFFRGNPEQRARNEYNSQFSTGDIYGYGMGAGNLSNKDAFGYNTVSGFGNYEQHMKDKVEELEDLLTRTNRKSFKPGTYQFNMLKDYTKNINKIQEDNRTRKEEAQKALERELAKYAAQNRIYGSGGGRDESLNTGPGGSYSGRGDQGATTANFSGDFATDSASYDMKDGGPVGLASMFVRRG